MSVHALEVPSRKGQVSPEEWAVRVDLAAAYRLVAHFGWEDLVFTHITARVPTSCRWRASGPICSPTSSWM